MRKTKIRRKYNKIHKHNKTRKHLTRKRKIGGRKFDSPDYLPHLLSYQDITDNSSFLQEIPNPTDINSYEINNTYVIQLKIPGSSDANYYKFLLKSKSPPILSFFPIITKGLKYGIARPKNINVNNIQYAYKVLNKGYISFNELASEMQDTSNIKSLKEPYQKILQDKYMTNKIKGYF